MGNELPPLVRMLAGELRRLNMDVEYRGDGDRLHLVGDTGKADAAVLNAVKAGRTRTVAALKPLWDACNRPVRLCRDAAAGAADREPATPVPAPAEDACVVRTEGTDDAEDGGQVCGRCDAVVWPNRFAPGTGPTTCQPHVRTWLGVDERPPGRCPFAPPADVQELEANPPAKPTAAPAPAKATPPNEGRTLFDARPSA